VLGRFDGAFAWAEQLLPEAREASTPGATLCDYVLLRGVSAAALGGTLPGRRRRLRIARACLRRLRVWARRSPDCVLMVALLEAEVLRMRRRSSAALAQYQTAAAAAAAARFVHYAALAHERRASLLREGRRDMEAALALRDALACYTRWEAHAKAEELRERLGNS